MTGKFSPSSFWNTPLPASQTLDPASPEIVAALLSQVAMGPWLNTSAYSVPIYQPAPGTRPVKVTLTEWGPSLQEAFDAVPVPVGALAAAGYDEHMVVWNTHVNHNEYWEFWHMRQTAGVWSAAWGGYMDDMTTNPGYFTFKAPSGETNWGATATGLPLIGGLITHGDVVSTGSINHVLAMAVISACQHTFRSPAQRTDGHLSAGVIQEGQRFRLDPTFDCSKLTIPLVRMMAEAAQKYGIVVRDQSGAVTFYGEDPKTMPRNPFPDLLVGKDTASAMRTFPWSHLQALPPL